MELLTAKLAFRTEVWLLDLSLYCLLGASPGDAGKPTGEAPGKPTGEGGNTLELMNERIEMRICRYIVYTLYKYIVYIYMISYIDEFETVVLCQQTMRSMLEVPDNHRSCKDEGLTEQDIAMRWAGTGDMQVTGECDGSKFWTPNPQPRGYDES